jgi:hypothetical protein
MKKIIALSLTIIMVFSLFACGKDEVKEYSDITFTVLDATSGNNENEEAISLFDADASTKWCVVDFSKAEVTFEANKPIKIKGYSFVTGNDNSYFNGRNPMDWELSGSNDNRAWVTLDEQSGNRDIPDKDKVKCDFPVLDIDEEYKYFKLEITKVQSGACMQLSEFVLDYNGSEYVCNNLSDDNTSAKPVVTSSTTISTTSSSVVQTNPTQAPTQNQGKYLGSQTVYNGAEYTLGVGDSIMLMSSRVGGTSYSAYNWFADTADGGITLEKNSSMCTVKAVRTGRYEITATYDYYISGVGNQSYTDKITIVVTNESQGNSNSGSSSNNSSSGSSYSPNYNYNSYTNSYNTTTRRCNKCKGTGYYTCSSCNGAGYKIKYGSVPNYAGSSSGNNSYSYKEYCSYCSNGKIRCYCGS